MATGAAHEFDTGYPDASEPEAAPRSGVARVLATTFWAAASVGVFAGAVVWAYGLGLRNPADVPALRIAAEQYKRPPADPGGTVYPDQQRRVFSEIDGSAPAAQGPARRAGDPERPTPADVAVAARQVGSAQLSAMVAEAAASREAAKTTRIIDTDYLPVATGTVDAPRQAPPAIPANVGAGVGEQPPGAQGVDVAPATPPVETAARGGAGAAPQPAPQQAPTPAPAPVDAPPEADAPPPAEDAAPAPTAADPAAPAPAPVAPAPVAPVADPADGRVYQVQLAALESVALVRARWAEIRGAQPDLLGGYGLDIQPVSVGDAELFRLRLNGLRGRSAAAELCSELRKRGVDCFVAVKK